jgi:putative SOS response-associated peptidase YedK
MCGRFTLARPAREVAEAFGLVESPEWEPRYNISPTQQVFVVRAAGGARAGSLMRWGITPKWSAAPLINAKAESAAEKPTFRPAFKSRRCLFASDGFYEWSQEGKKKQPYWFSLADGGLFAVAGLWEPSEEGASALLLTTEANEVVRPVHHRMPLILPREEWGLWLDPEVSDAARLQPLLRPYPAALMTRLAVNAAVGSPRVEGPRCIEPAAAEPARASLF